MKKISLNLLLILTLLFTTQVFPQKKIFTIEDVVFGSVTNLTSGRIQQLKWLPNNLEFSYLESNQDDMILVKEHVKNKMKSTVVSLNELNRKLKTLEINLGSSFPRYEWMTDELLRLQKGDTFYFISTKNNELVNKLVLPKDAENIEFAESGINYAYTIKNNLFANINGEDIQITDDENEHIVNGKSVHRNEFGITKGIFWSPDFKSIAFYRMIILLLILVKSRLRLS